MNKTPIILAIMMIWVVAAGAQNRAARVAQKAGQVKEQIEARDFTIIVNQMIPFQSQSIYLNGTDGIRLKGDSIYSFLPYIGRAFSVPYGGGKGLNFSTVVTDYAMKYGRKNAAEITFTARTPEDSYDYRITVFPNGTASINIQPQQRQPISFNGELKPQ